MLINSAILAQRGATLVSLMIGVLVGLIVVFGGLNFYLIVIRAHTGMLNDARLTRELSDTMTVIADELRRAGYNATITALNPFTTTMTDLTILENGSCILYTYDRNENGSVGQNEFYGFRMRDQRIETRTSGSSSQNCNEGDWLAITDSRVTRMTELYFHESAYTCVNTNSGRQWESRCDDKTASGYEPPSKGDPLSEIRRISVLISGSLTNDNFLTWQQYQQTVQPRNHRMILATGQE